MANSEYGFKLIKKNSGEFIDIGFDLDRISTNTLMEDATIFFFGMDGYRYILNEQSCVNSNEIMITWFNNVQGNMQLATNISNFNARDIDDGTDFKMVSSSNYMDTHFNFTYGSGVGSAYETSNGSTATISNAYVIKYRQSDSSREISNTIVNNPNFLRLYIPQSVNTIEDNAFYGNANLTAVTIGANVVSIGNNAFKNNPSLKTVVWPSTSNFSSIGNNSFDGCGELVGLELNHVKTIGSEAFKGCSKFSKLELPSSVEAIGNNAFNGCSSISSITYNAKCDITSNLGLSSCSSSLKKLSIGSYTKKIGSSTFNGFSSLSSVTLTNGLQEIGESAFTSCHSIKSLSVPNSVTKIGDYAFTNCSGLTSCTIGTGVTTIGDSTFVGCSKLPISNYARYADSFLVECTNKNYSSYTIKSGTKWIGINAFSNCEHMTRCTIPNSVKRIGEESFNGCTALTACTIGTGVTSIGDNAFNGDSSLTSITINATTPPTLGNGVFDNTNDCPIYVPSGRVQAYKSASGWSDYENRIQG